MSYCGAHLLFRLGVVTFLVLLAGSVPARPAAAHPDLTVATGRHRIAAGDVLIFPVELHYHRLVGRVRVLSPGSGTVTVRVRGPDDRTGFLAAGPGATLALNELVACCKGSTWTPHQIVVENPGDRAVEVALRLVLLHDGIAVTGADAERGAAPFPIVLFAFCSALFGWRLVRGRPKPGEARPWALWAAIAFAAVWVVPGGLGASGMLAYGGGPIAGTVAVTADLPWTGNHFVTTSILIQVGAMALWVIAVGAWTAAVRRAGPGRGVGALGIVIGTGSLLACLAWAVEYETLMVPILVGIAGAALPLGGGLLLLGQAHRRNPLPQA